MRNYEVPCTVMIPINANFGREIELQWPAVTHRPSAVYETGWDFRRFL